jgi:hypothetical protein
MTAATCPDCGAPERVLCVDDIGEPRAEYHSARVAKATAARLDGAEAAQAKKYGNEDDFAAEPDLVGPFPPVPTEAQIDALIADARRAADAAGLPQAEELPADSPLLAALRAAEERVLWMLERFATRSGPMLIEWEQLREVADLIETARVEAEEDNAARELLAQEAEAAP